MVAAVVEREGRFLLVEEVAEGRVVLNQPAGHLERAETLAEAVRREVLEETGRHFEPEGIVGVYLYQRPGLDQAYLRVCFCGRASEQDPTRPLDAEILRTVWLSREELEAGRERLRSPLVRACVEDYLAGRRYGLELLRVPGAG